MISKNNINLDRSIYNKAGKLTGTVYHNGVVDIVPTETGKLSISKTGMITLVKNWLEVTNSHEISTEDKADIIELLKNK